MNYRVKWEIDLEADTAQEAAEQALASIRNPEGFATCFDVSEVDVDGVFGGFVTVDLAPTPWQE